MYTTKGGSGVKDWVSANSMDVSSTGVHTTHKSIMRRVQVTRIMALVDTVMSSTGAIVVKFWRRPTYGSTAGQVLIGQLSIPATQAAGSVVYKEISQVTLNPGEEVTYECTTAATTSGKALFDFEYEDAPEAAANSSNMVASA